MWLGVRLRARWKLAAEPVTARRRWRRVPSQPPLLRSFLHRIQATAFAQSLRRGSSKPRWVVGFLHCSLPPGCPSSRQLACFSARSSPPVCDQHVHDSGQPAGTVGTPAGDEQALTRQQLVVLDLQAQQIRQAMHEREAKVVQTVRRIPITSWPPTWPPARERALRPVREPCDRMLATGWAESDRLVRWPRTFTGSG